MATLESSRFSQFKPDQRGTLRLEYEDTEIILPVKLSASYEKRGLTIGRFIIEDESRQKFGKEYDRFLNLVFNRPVPSVPSKPARMLIPLISRSIQSHRKGRAENRNNSR